MMKLKAYTERFIEFWFDHQVTIYSLLTVFALILIITFLI